MLPNPEIQPLLRPNDIVGLHPTLRRTAVYDAIKRGDIPSITIGSRIFIPTASLRRVLHLDDGRDTTQAGPLAVDEQPHHLLPTTGAGRLSTSKTV